MNATLTLDKAGRIVLPKPVREELHIKPGDALELECAENAIVLRPARGKGRLRQKHGVWVFDSGEPLDVKVVENTRRQIYEEREQRFLGKSR